MISFPVKYSQNEGEELAFLFRRCWESGGPALPTGFRIVSGCSGRLVSYLRLNYSQSVRLAELADVAGFAPSYLSRVFKEEVGMTVSEYLRMLRCEQAARLLRETDLPVSEISAYVGYPDHNYFIKAFRKQYKMTPGAYRGRNRA